MKTATNRQPGEGNDPWQPVQMDSSPTLFPMGLEEFLNHALIPSERLRDWHIAGWLSFDPTRTMAFEEAHLAEVRVIKSVVDLGLAPSLTRKLIDDLPKPCQFDPHRLSYNFHLGRWQMLPRRTEEEIAVSVREELVAEYEENVEAYIDWLAGEADLNRLSAFKERIENAIERAVRQE